MSPRERAALALACILRHDTASKATYIERSRDGSLEAWERPEPAVQRAWRLGKYSPQRGECEWRAVPLLDVLERGPDTVWLESERPPPTP